MGKVLQGYIEAGTQGGRVWGAEARRDGDSSRFGPHARNLRGQETGRHAGRELREAVMR